MQKTGYYAAVQSMTDPGYWDVRDSNYNVVVPRQLRSQAMDKALVMSRPAMDKASVQTHSATR